MFTERCWCHTYGTIRYAAYAIFAEVRGHGPKTNYTSTAAVVIRNILFLPITIMHANQAQLSRGIATKQKKARSSRNNVPQSAEVW